MLGKTNAVSGKQKYGAYNIEEVEVDGGVVLEITDADEKPVDKLQLRIDNGGAEYLFMGYNGGSEVMAEMLKGLDTSNVTTMQSMFNKCTEITTLDLSNFDTSNVTTMNAMFQSCDALTDLNLSSFNTQNVTNMLYMLSGLSSITELNLSNFNTSNVTTMQYMFSRCSNLLELDLTSFDFSRLTTITGIFLTCKAIKLIKFNIIKPLNSCAMRDIFNGCFVLEEIQGVLDLYNANNVEYMFANTYALTGATLKNIRRSLQIGSGTTYGHLWELPYLVNAIKELWDLTGSTQQTLTIGSANLEKIANVYVKLVEVTDEMTAQDPYAANKLPCVECESTDEGAMTLTAYAGLKNWVLA